MDVAVDGGGEWRNQNNFALSWSNPSEADRAPIVAAIDKLCPAAGGGGCSQGEQDGEGVASLPIQVPAPGEWTVSLYLRDGAGNQDPNAASVPVTLRYDPDPPQLGFEQSPASDPTLISVQVSDKTSGLADGRIEISPAGSDTWRTLDTQKDGSRLVARIDDAATPAGNYVLRATAYDQAHNEASTTQRLDGQPMAVTLPLRITSVMQAGVPRERTIRRTVTRHGKRKTVRTRVTVLRPASGVAFGRRVQVTGRLLNRDGQGIAGADVQVLSRSDVSPEQLVAVLHTDGSGSYTYTATGEHEPHPSIRVCRVVVDPSGASGGPPAGPRGELAARQPPARAQRARGDVQRPRPDASRPRGRQAHRASGVALGALADVSHRAHRPGGAMGAALPIRAHPRPAALSLPRRAATRGRLPVHRRQVAIGSGPRDRTVMQPFVTVMTTMTGLTQLGQR